MFHLLVEGGMVGDEVRSRGDGWRQVVREVGLPRVRALKVGVARGGDDDVEGGGAHESRRRGTQVVTRERVERRLTSC
jgi:hypothetical protein